MNNEEDLYLIIDNIVQLLKSVKENNWSIALSNVKENYKQVGSSGEEQLINNILQMYGGMGSFSDLVLYSNGEVLIKENQELDVLRKKLFSYAMNCKAGL